MTGCAISHDVVVIITIIVIVVVYIRIDSDSNDLLPCHQVQEFPSVVLYLRDRYVAICMEEGGIAITK